MPKTSQRETAAGVPKATVYIQAAFPAHVYMCVAYTNDIAGRLDEWRHQFLRDYGNDSRLDSLSFNLFFFISFQTISFLMAPPHVIHDQQMRRE